MLAQALTGTYDETQDDASFVNKNRENGNLLDENQVKKIKNHANEIRKSIISMLLEAGSGHTAGAMGMSDIFSSLYFSVLKHDPKNPEWEERDRVILSNGHICPVLYATLAEAGYFEKSELETLRKIDSRLQGHPHIKSIAGVENTSGPLGQALSQAIGVALAFKLDQKPSRVFCLMSDGEMQEGQNWEAFMYAGNKKLNNITVLIDRNNIQIGGFTHEIMPLKPLKQKLEAFGWHTLEIDGHNIEQILDSCQQAKVYGEGPTAIICNTSPGKGVDFMENLPEWHGKPPNKEEAEKALDQLNNQEGGSGGF